MADPLAAIRDKESVKKAALFIILALAALLDVVFFMRPQVSRVFEAMRTTKSVAMELKQANDAISKTDIYKKTILSYEEQINRYEKMLPAEKEVPALLESLSAMARNSGAKIIGITPIADRSGRAPASSGGNIYQEIPILINAKSGYHELGNFINDMENSDRFMKVVDIDIRANRQTPAKHDVELVVLTYTLLKGK